MTPPMDEAMELKLCPFCGGEPIADDLGDPADDSFVHCSKCEVQQIANYTPEVAARRWNTRAAIEAFGAHELAGALEACLALAPRPLKATMNLSGESAYDKGIAALKHHRGEP